MVKKRYLTKYIVEDLNDKMVFISGARQVGKTTLSTELVKDYFQSASYYNWDYKQDRQAIMNAEWKTDADLIILDEVHKYSKWKTLVKGNYDKWKDRFKFLVTGSARLNIYRRGGDSMQGRYHHYRLHPFSLAEYCAQTNKITPLEKLDLPSMLKQEELELLFKFGGFPEPLIRQNERALRRWHQEKTERLFKEDIRELELIRDFGSMQLLSDMIPSKVGSLLSINALREDLEVSHKAVSHWMDILEGFYYHYRIYPFASKNVRSLKKEPKLYLWDWSEVEDRGARFENLIASHLLKLVHFLKDREGYNAALHFLRDKDKREVDFLVTIDGKPWFACEAKVKDTSIATEMLYFKDRLKIPYVYQVVLEGTKDFERDGIHVLPAARFLLGLI